MNAEERRSKELKSEIEQCMRELASDIMELENLHKPIEMAHELSRREYKTLLKKMQMIHEISRRCSIRLYALQLYEKKTKS